MTTLKPIISFPAALLCRASATSHFSVAREYELLYNIVKVCVVPQFRPKATLERSASADLYKNTLSRIPTVFGRLAYLASLRDPHSGVYRHHGFAATFGREESRKALGLSHEAVFQEWLNLPLTQKHQDATEYLDSLEVPRSEVLAHWAKVPDYRNYIPASARASERELFFAEFEVLLEAFRCSDAPGSGRS